MNTNTTLFGRPARHLRGAAMMLLALLAPVATLGANELPTVSVSWEGVTRERGFDGIVEAERRSTVSAQVAARIEELPFDVDDYVERGDIIVDGIELSNDIRNIAAIRSEKVQRG